MLTTKKKYQVIVGKLFPFWVLVLVILTVGLLIAKVVFNVPMLGNIFLCLWFHISVFAINFRIRTIHI